MSIYDKKYDLLVFGEPMVQYTIKGSDITKENLQNPSVGGEDIFVAATVAKHGFSPVFFSAIAQDPYENLIRETLNKHNINTEFCISDGGYNGIEILNDNDNENREFFYNRPAGFDSLLLEKPLYPENLEDLIKQCKVIYASSAFTLSSLEARSLVFESFHYAHKNKVCVVFDPNIRLHRHNLAQLRETIWMLMPFIDFFSMTAASGEMRSLFGTDDSREVALDLVERNVRYAAIRNGKESVFFAYRDEDNNNKINYGNVPVSEVENGFFSYSGAVFNGAFISELYLNESSPEKAISHATQIAIQKCKSGNTLDTAFSMVNN